MKFIKRLIIIISFACFSNSINAQIPISQRSWQYVATQMHEEWYGSHRIKNTRWESFVNKDGQKDRRIVKDPSAGDMWARFYDLKTELPYVCDRDGIKKSSMEEIGYERRNGYSWYTDAPQEIIDKYSSWKAKWVK